MIRIQKFFSSRSFSRASHHLGPVLQHDSLRRCRQRRQLLVPHGGRPGERGRPTAAEPAERERRRDADVAANASQRLLVVAHACARTTVFLAHAEVRISTITRSTREARAKFLVGDLLEQYRVELTRKYGEAYKMEVRARRAFSRVLPHRPRDRRNRRLRFYPSLDF